MSVVVWFRNNLRVRDNEALTKAVKSGKPVVGLYCFDPYQYTETSFGFPKTGAFRTKFLFETLQDLKVTLAEKNISLFVYHRATASAFEDLMTRVPFTEVFTQKEWTSEEVAVQNKISEKLPHVKFTETYDQFLWHPDDVPYDNWSQIPEVFTNFRKKCEYKVRIRPLFECPSMPASNLIETIDETPTYQALGLEKPKVHPNSAFPFRGGETAAWKRLNHYFFDTEALSNYKQTRNGLLGTDYSSKFSAWLANGSLSARSIYHEIQEYERHVCKNEDTYWLYFELMWRDFFKYISLKHGNKIFQLNGISKWKYDWPFSTKKFQHWINADTGTPFVDANMMELKKTGFMSNRGRQNVASFWSKEWCQNWLAAAAYFESQLVDYDVHSNYGNWLYVSGVGNDPRDRKFSIPRQAEMYDPKREFQDTWI